MQGFQSHLPGLFELFSNLLRDPESIEVRVTTVRCVSHTCLRDYFSKTFTRSLGVVAQYIDGDEKPLLVSHSPIFEKE